MNNPLKIIFKYKNVSGAVQYNSYIFIGNISNKIFSILNKFNKLSLLNTLKTLSKGEIKELVDYYGSHWYTYFFIYNHIEHSRNTIPTSFKKYLQSKLGKEWYDIHFNTEMVGGNADIYSNVNNDYFDNNDELIGGDNDDKEEEIDDDKGPQEFSQDDSEQKPTSDSEKSASDSEKSTSDDDDDDNLYDDYNEQETNEELENEGNVDTLKSKEKQNKSIETLIKKFDKTESKTINSIYKFETSKNQNYKSEELHDVYNKIYIRNSYIYQDDDILTIKKKICISILNDPIINNDCYILPSRQYLWSQYKVNNKLHKMMIGHKYEDRENVYNIIEVEPKITMDNYYTKNKYNQQLRDLTNLNLLKLEDDNDVVFADLSNVIINNELFMIDVYHELYELKDTQIDENSDDIFKLLYEGYIKIYFPNLKLNDLQEIFKYLKKTKSNEFDIIKINYNTIKLDLFTINKPISIVTSVREKYDTIKYLEYLYITLANIKVDISTEMIDLYLIFENFIVSKTIPFIRYHNKNHKNFFKIYTKTSSEDKEQFLKWIENTPIGISLKIYLEEYKKYVTLKIYDTGKIEYTTQWKENQQITIKNVEDTYPLIISIIKNIIRMDSRIKLKIPRLSDFRIEFVNAIQILNFKSDKKINFENIKDFSKYFAPYIIPIKQSDSKLEQHSVHLVYKRISKYDNIESKRIENNIIDIMKNYDYTPENLIVHIMNNLNISKDEAINQIENVQQKYKFSKRKKVKTSKRIDKLPRYKQPGININIQRSQLTKYIVRITGCKGKQLLRRIIIFMSIFMFLYFELVVLKKYPNIYSDLEKIASISLKINKSSSITEEINMNTNIKHLVQLDKDRFGFTPKVGTNNYSRMCLKEFQPLGFNNSNLDKLNALGYKYDEKVGTYTMPSVSYKKRKNKLVKHEVTLKAVKLKNKQTGEDIYYACHPDINKKNYQHISFQDLSKHPNKMCMPCCNKQNQMESNKPNIRRRYEVCTSESKITELDADLDNILYISKDTNKLSNNKFGFLPEHLDIFINNLTGNKLVLKDEHYLEETLPSYFFKLGLDVTNETFLQCIEICFNIKIPDIKKKIITALKNDKNEQLFISLYGGKLKLLFNTIENYISYIENTTVIDYHLIYDILCHPGIIYEHGINIFVFKRQLMYINLTDKNQQRIDEITLDCHQNYYNKHFTNTKRRNIIIFKHNEYFYPIIQVDKKLETKNVSKYMWFSYTETNIISHILDYYNLSCVSTINKSLFLYITNISSEDIYNLLLEKSKTNKEYLPIAQQINSSYKCVSFVFKNNYVLNIQPSNVNYNLPFIDTKTIQKYIYTFQKTYTFILDISKLFENKYDYESIAVLYSKENKKKYYINYIKCKNNVIFDIVPQWITLKELQKLKLKPINYFIMDNIVNTEIMKGTKNIKYDDRLQYINYSNYISENYELLRLHISTYLNKNKSEFNSILKVLNNTNDDSPKITNIKFEQLYKILYNICKSQFFIKSVNQNDLQVYNVINKRVTCNTLNKEQCDSSLHCNMTGDTCKFKLTSDKIEYFISKLIDELLNNPLKKSELLQEDEYYVSSIVNREKFTERENQHIIREDIVSFEQSLYNIFGKEAKPIIGKKMNKSNIVDSKYIELNEEHSLKYYKTFFIQKIIQNNNSLFRAYTNGFFWIKNQYETIQYRNFGYIFPIQTQIANYFKSICVDTLIKLEKTNKVLSNYTDNITKYAYNLYTYQTIYTKCIPELIALNYKYNEIPIYIYDYNYNIIYIIDETKVIYDKKIKVIPAKYNLDKTKTTSIHLKFIYDPEEIDKIINIDVLYYSAATK